MDIWRKSIGCIFDEYITTRFKCEINPTEQNIERRRLLNEAIEEHVGVRYYTDTILYQLHNRLYVISRQCWNAQEKIGQLRNTQNYKELAKQAIAAQETNALRNELIRQIDKHLGEQDITPLEKTYK